MIRSFPSRALKRFWERSDERRLPPDFIWRIAMMLDRLDAATRPEQMDAVGLGFHRLTGDMCGRYAVTVSRTWRVTFAWSDKDAVDIDLEDYH